MGSVIASRALALSMYAFTRIFYTFEVSWVESPPPNAWKDISVFAFLNHTSLLEPLFLGAFPLSFLWDAAKRATVPGADITMNRPIAGFFYRLFSPRTISISRKRDDTWAEFLDQIRSNDLVALAPEGRMMRPNGLDKHGKPMSVRGGIADILLHLKTGKFLLGYSGGLHHVNQPGQKGFKLFKTLKMRFEILDIETYLAQFEGEKTPQKRLLIAKDLENRLKQYKPL